MRVAILVLTIAMLAGCLLAGESRTALSGTSAPAGTSKQLAAQQPNTLCAKDERIIFSCPVKRPAKIVSLCASKDLTSDQGYLQYRFGLPGKIELEYPKDRQGTQQKFQYSHYFRARFELTSINFTIDGYEYSVFDDYNGEENPEVISRGVSVTAPGKPKADYSDLQAVLPGQE